MPVSPKSTLETVSLVLTKSQAAQLRTLARAMSTPNRQVSFSEVGREVVERGLPVVFRGLNTAFYTSQENGTSEDAA